tara:strand:+ start:885 stop:1187 length:303 start_codon:yes stop_codon:yes gene_type:complete
MANHKSALKRIRQTNTRNLKNRLQHKTTRNAIKTLKDSSDKKEAEKLLVNVTSLLDKLAKNNIIHKNKSANLKSKLSKHVNSLKSKSSSKSKVKAKAKSS